jgi:uncharacterized membrane protein (UPF0127 family)
VTAAHRIRPAWLLLAVALLFGASCSSSGSADSVDVHIGGLIVRTEVARTTEQRGQGLGDRDSLAPDAGMLFVFAEESVHPFCMCGMRFPLDFVWISADRRIVGLTEHVQPPEVAGRTLSVRTEAATKYVLEVNAGVIAANGLAVGQEVRFDPDPGEAD